MGLERKNIAPFASYFKPGKSNLHLLGRIRLRTRRFHGPAKECGGYNLTYGFIQHLLNPHFRLQGMMQAFEADKWILREGDTGTITWTPPRAMQTDKVECTLHSQTFRLFPTVLGIFLACGRLCLITWHKGLKS
jgi:hypothetical protein